MATRNSTFGLKRVWTPRGRRWYATDLGQYVAVKLELPSKEEISKKLKDIESGLCWEAGCIRCSKKGRLAIVRRKRYRRLTSHQAKRKATSPLNQSSIINPVPLGKVELSGDLARDFGRLLSLVAQFIRESKDALSDLREVVSSKKHARDRYLMKINMDLLETEGMLGAREILKKSNAFSKFVKTDEHDRKLIDLEHFEFFLFSASNMHSCLHRVLILSGRVKPRKKSTQGFFEEGLKLIERFSNICQLVKIHCERARARARLPYNHEHGGWYGAA